MSLLTFVTANGQTPLVVKVFPFPKKKGEKTKITMNFQAVRKSKRIETGIMFEATAYTQTGWVTKEVWSRSGQEFCRVTKCFFHGKNAVIFMDRLPAHKDSGTIQTLKQHGIEVVFFPPKTSHFLQPLDQQIFRCVQKWLENNTSE